VATPQPLKLKIDVKYITEIQILQRISLLLSANNIDIYHELHNLFHIILLRSIFKARGA
jgi:hypothetical protein